MDAQLKILVKEIQTYSKDEDPINIRNSLDELFDEVLRLKQIEDYKKISYLLSPLIYDKYVVEYDYWILVEYSLALYELRIYDEALAVGKLFMKIEPNDPYCIVAYALILKMNKMFDEAIEILNFALNKGKNKKYIEKYKPINKKWTAMLNDIRYLLGTIYFHNNDLESSIKLLKSHIKHRRQGLASIVTKRSVVKELDEVIFLNNYNC